MGSRFLRDAVADACNPNFIVLMDLFFPRENTYSDAITPDKTIRMANPTASNINFFLFILRSHFTLILYFGYSCCCEIMQLCLSLTYREKPEVLDVESQQQN